MIAGIGAGVCFKHSFAEQGSARKVIAYYFHGTFRCPTCMRMEQYAGEAINARFREAIADGRLEFRSVNVDERDNRHFADDYHLYTKALVLSYVKDGREVKSKNLERIWEYVRDKQKFYDYVTEELTAFMNNLL